MEHTSAREKWKQFLSSRRGKRLTRWVRRAFTLGVLAIILWQLRKIGWSDVLTSLPGSPWFYLVFLVMFFLLPVVEARIYGMIWKLPFSATISATLRKRVYNKELFGYTGELFMFFWGQKNLDMPRHRVMHGVKDNTIVSSVTSTLVAFSVLGYFYFSGLVELPNVLREYSVVYVAAAALLVLVVVLVAIRFRKSILHLSARLLGTMAIIHLVRHLMILSLQILEWNVAMPEIPVQSWFTFLSVQLVISRIPLPSSSFVFLGAGTHIAERVGIPMAPFFAMVAVHTVLDKLLNLILFSWLSFRDRKSGDLPVPGLTDSAAEGGPTAEPDATAEPDPTAELDPTAEGGPTAEPDPTADTR